MKRLKKMRISVLSPRNAVLTSLFVVVGIVPMMMNTAYIYRLLLFFSLYTVLAQAYNFIAGYTGQYPFGNAGFFGIGAYGVAVFWLSGGWFTGMSLGVAVGVSAAVLLSLACIPLFRLAGIFFAMGTLFVAEILKAIMLRWDAVGGAGGIVIPTRGVSYNLPAICYIAYLFSVAAILLTHKISNAKTGYAFKAIREDEFLAESIGIRPLKYKALAFAINALLNAIAGGIYAYSFLFVEPRSVFDINWGLLPCYMMIIGGKGTLWGPLFGAVFYATMLEAVSGLRELQMFFFGATVILVVLFSPKGLHGMLKTFIKFLKGKKED